jgi:hypothetical protein
VFKSFKRYAELVLSEVKDSNRSPIVSSLADAGNLRWELNSLNVLDQHCRLSWSHRYDSLTELDRLGSISKPRSIDKANAIL